MVRRLAGKAALTIAGLLLAAALFAGPPDRANQASRPGRSPNLPLFLDVFRAPDDPIVAEPFEFNSANGGHGALYRPKSNERLPGLLLIADRAGAEFFVQTARELAGVGYAVLIVPAVNADGNAMEIECTTASVHTAVRRLKSRRGRSSGADRRAGLGAAGEARSPGRRCRIRTGRCSCRFRFSDDA